jgi:hypothetical protein
MSLRLIGLTLVGLVALAACGGGGGSNEGLPSGTLELTVVDGDTNTGLSNVGVIVIDGATGESIDLLTTDGTGRVSKTYATGALQLRVSSQNYAPSPPPGIPPLPVQIVANQTTSVTVSIDALPAAERGMISGQVTNDQEQPAGGALIVVTAGDGTVLSTTAHADGGYVLHNVPIGTATLTAFLGGYNFDPTGPVTVITDANTDQNIMAVGTANGEISGHVSFTSISGDIIDITLLHPITRDTLPNLRVLTDGGGSYLMRDVPYGEFEIIASLENDGFVLDPDLSVTQGIPMVLISEIAPVIANKDFKVTGSIELTNPASITDASVPELGDLPIFTWAKASSYASADYYVVEVVDESGDTVWGGFDSPANNFTPLVTVPQGNDPSAGYNFDGTATLASLGPERYYQLRVYAVVVDTAEAKGYRLLSAGETLDGIFWVTPIQ